MSLVVPFEEIFTDEGLLCKAKHWERVELKLAVSILNGFPLKSTAFNSEKGFPVIRIRDLKFNKIQTYYSQDFPKEYVVSNGDLLVGMDGDFICYEWSGGKAVLNQRVCKLIADENFLLKRFLFYGINGYLNAIQKATSSVTVGHLSSIDTGKIPFPLPPIEEQHRIVTKLDLLFQKTESNKQRLEKIPIILKRFRQSVLAAAVSGKMTEEWREQNENVQSGENIKDNLPELPESWSWKKLPEIGFLGRGKSRNRPRDAAHLYGGKYPFIQTGDIANSGGRIKSHKQTYSEAGLAQSKLWETGTVCITIAANIADTAILTYPACFPDSVVGFVADNEKSLPEYVEFFIRTIKSDLWNYAPATAQKNINVTILNEVFIATPPHEEQKEIVKRVEQLFAFADKLEARYAKAKTMIDKLPQSILAKAFRGELVPQNPNDEPASVLLERIKAEKEKLAAENLPAGKAGNGKKSKAYSIEEKPLRVAAEGKVKYKKKKK